MKQQINFRSSELTAGQLATLVKNTGMNQTEVIAIAIDRMFREEKMTIRKTAHITILNDDEAMFSGIDSAEMEKIDVEKTIEDYTTELAAALADEFPEYEFEHRYGPYSGKSIRIMLLDDEENEDLIDSMVSEVISRVYERGTFWTTKAD